MKLPFRVAGIFLLALTSFVNAEPHSGTTIDRGDSYPGSGGRSVHLLRAGQEIAVRYAEDFSAEEVVRRVRNATGDGTVSLRASHAPPAERRIDFLHVADGEKAGAALVNHSEVAFVTPVFISPESGARVVPLDAILVKIAAGASIEPLQKELRPEGLELVEKLRLPDTYKFRVIHPAATNVFAVALIAGKKPGVVFAEPSFLMEWFLEPPSDPQRGQLTFRPLPVVDPRPGRPAEPHDHHQKFPPKQAQALITGRTSGAVTGVFFRVGNSGPFKEAVGTTSWSFLTKLRKGKNVIVVIATGPEGNSRAKKVVITRP